MPDGPSPTRDGSVTLAGGRTIAWAEWGDPDGPAVVLVHRNPGSRLFDPDPATTERAGARLITIDRPGYGGTDSLPEPSRAAIATDVVAVLDELAVDDAALVGWSGGGMFALEAAAQLGGRSRSLSLCCTPAPDNAIPWVPDEFRPLTEKARSDPKGALADLTAACSFYAQDPEALVDSDPGPADAKVRDGPGVRERLAAMMREGARQGALGMATDIVAGSRDEPLPLEAVPSPVQLWYGEADWIGPEHGRWYEERFPDARLTVVPGAGHLLPLTSWSNILDAALTARG